MLNELVKEGKKLRLKLNEDKTKIMRFGKQLVNNMIKIGEYRFEEVDKYKYLGIIIAIVNEKLKLKKK